MRRLAGHAGLPEAYAEPGYFGIYEPGYTIGPLHLDNHHVFYNPSVDPAAYCVLIFYPHPTCERNRSRGAAVLTTVPMPPHAARVQSRSWCT